VKLLCISWLFQVEAIIVREGGRNWRFLPAFRNLPWQRKQQLAAELGVSRDEFCAAEASRAARQSVAAQAAADAAVKQLAEAKAAAVAAAAAAGGSSEDPSAPDSSTDAADSAVKQTEAQQEALAAADEAVTAGFVDVLNLPVYEAIRELEQEGRLQTVRVANATADEVIAVFVHLNATSVAGSSSPSRNVIRSGDKTFGNLVCMDSTLLFW
jgi:nucleoid-associated protein YgaU